jgi:hypothetical protein
VKPVRLLASLLATLLAWPCAASAQTQDKQPSTFAPVIGAALLCHDQIDNAYFYDYLKTRFGAPYRHDGGAWWFRTGDATLWGAAVAEVPPDELEQAIRKSAGVRHLAADGSAYPLRISAPGSTIAYYNAKSKIYCAKFKPLPAKR